MKLWIITAIVAVFALAPIAECKTNKKSDLFDKDDKDLKNSERKERDFQRLRDAGLAIELPEKAESMTDDMAELDKAVTLTEQQKTKMTQLRTTRDKILANWEKANRKKFTILQTGLEKLESRRDMRKCKAIVSQMQSMAKSRNMVITSYERKFFTMLTPVQRGKWNAPVLADVLLEEFGALELTEEQTKKINTAAETQAKRLAVPLGSGDPPAKLMGPIMKYVYTRILNPKQRKAYALSKRPEPTVRKRR